jgi:hypothetical protein
MSGPDPEVHEDDYQPTYSHQEPPESRQVEPRSEPPHAWDDSRPRSEHERRLDRLRAVLGPEAADDALRFMPTRVVEEAAARDARQRQATDATAIALTMRGTRDAVLAGTFGKEARAELLAEIVRHGGDANATEILHAAARLAAAERKAEYLRRLQGPATKAK